MSRKKIKKLSSGKKDLITRRNIPLNRFRVDIEGEPKNALRIKPDYADSHTPHRGRCQDSDICLNP